MAGGKRIIVRNKVFNKILPIAILVGVALLSVSFYFESKSVPVKDETHTYAIQHRGNPPTFTYITEAEGKVSQLSFTLSWAIIVLMGLSAIILKKIENK